MSDNTITRAALDAALRAERLRIAEALGRAANPRHHNDTRGSCPSFHRLADELRASVKTEPARCGVPYRGEDAHYVCANPLPCALHPVAKAEPAAPDVCSYCGQPHKGGGMCCQCAGCTEPGCASARRDCCGKVVPPQADLADDASYLRPGVWTPPACAPKKSVPRGHCWACDRCGSPHGDVGNGCLVGDCSRRPLPPPRSHCAGCGAPYEVEWQVPAAEDCPGCAKVKRHPGEGYGCAFHPETSTAGATAALVAGAAKLLTSDNPRGDGKPWTDADIAAVVADEMAQPGDTAAPVDAQVTRLQAENLALRREYEGTDVGETLRRSAAKLAALTRAVVDAGCAVDDDGTVHNRRAESLEHDYKIQFECAENLRKAAERNVVLWKAEARNNGAALDDARKSLDKARAGGAARIGLRCDVAKAVRADEATEAVTPAKDGSKVGE